jgi:pyridoxamine 5'-phosphate oxidase
MTDPMTQFIGWLAEAKKRKDIAEPTAMCLATALDNKPSARIVLLKAIDTGFVFYTNLESRKSEEIKHNHHVALCFHWMPLKKQVRVEGVIEKVSEQEADAYFASRPRESQIGAWSSPQSRPLVNRGDLVKAVAENTIKFKNGPIPRPPFWSGWRVIPTAIEFWQEGKFRLHDREVFTRSGDTWDVKKLYP